MLNSAAERAQAFGDDVRDGLSSAQGQASGMANDAQTAAAGVADNLRNRTAQATSAVSDTLRSGMDAAKDKADAVKEAAATAPAQARQIIGDNAALIGGLGIAIGAIIAAALPQTKAEANVMGPASDGVKQAAADAAQSKWEDATDVATPVAVSSEKRR